MKIPFSLPVINQDVVDEMLDTLTNTGWLTSGPKVMALEKEIQALTTAPAVVCVNSWTSGAMLMLRWLGVGPGDEVIIPAYTYAATALAVLNMGAKPIMVDVQNDFTIDIAKIKERINEKTKAIIPVDIAGWPCNYTALRQLIDSAEVKALFQANSPKQAALGRIMLLADAAHSIGGQYQGRAVGTLADITVFSLHSVKNITTGEGGAICLNLPEVFDIAKEYTFLKALSLNGQNKSALEKNKPGSWKYDIIDQGLKVNMPDLCAAVGLAQIRQYKSRLLPERKEIFAFYNQALENCPWAIRPICQEGNTESSYHLYMLRIAGITEAQRDEMMLLIGQLGVGVNVHYIPMPLLTLFKGLGYRMEDYPNTYQLYANEISLPVYNNLSQEQLKHIIAAVKTAYNQVVGQE